MVASRNSDGSTNPSATEEQRRLRREYRRRLAGVPSPGNGDLESVAASVEADLSDAAIRDRVQRVEAELHRIVADLLGDQRRLHDLVDRIVAHGALALKMLGDDDDALHRDPAQLETLEAIVRTDGSRPSFLIRDGQVDPVTSPVGGWGEFLAASAPRLETAIQCVGRIDARGRHVGTGFLIQESLILTNRHVLQDLAVRDAEQGWQLERDAIIDFGREFKGRASSAPRALRRVVYTGPRAISGSGPIDHKFLDVALIELAPPDPANPVGAVLPLWLKSWVDPNLQVCTIGYPGRPNPLLYSLQLIEELFQDTFGYKRLAPGQVLPQQTPLEDWTVSHDCSTIGGNSGSPVLVIGNETNAAGIHYAGRSGPGAANFGHVLRSVLDTPGDALDPSRPELRATLRECLTQHAVTMIV